MATPTMTVLERYAAEAKVTLRPRGSGDEKRKAAMDAFYATLKGYLPAAAYAQCESDRRGLGINASIDAAMLRASAHADYLASMTIKQIILAAARACRVKADELDEAFVKHADPRSLQGGAICDDANELRELRKELMRLVTQADEMGV